jgi:hypothetical protein
MPGSINDFNHGNFAASQASVGGGDGVSTTNVSLAQSGGSRKKMRRKRRGMSGGLVPLSPSELGDTTGGQTGGYLASIFKAAIAPLGLMGLKKYSQESRRGKSRLSKKLRSRRHGRH